MFIKISNNRLSADTNSSSSSQTTSILESILANSKKFGSLPATLAKELSERESIITQMLITIPDESKIVKYFTDFLFVEKIPWSKARDLMSKALGAPSNGAQVEGVLDFALAHYKRKRNISQTKNIIDEGLKLQSSSRLTNIFGMLSDALENRPISMMSLQFSPDSIKDIFVFNRLVALSLNKNEEDTEMLRRSFVQALDELERTREVDDRYKAIFQMLQSNEMAQQLTSITEFVTRMFEISINDPVLLAFRRVMIQLRIGVEFRKQFFSDYQSEKTSDGIRDNSGDRNQEDKDKELLEVLRGRNSSYKDYNFVKLAQPTQQTSTSLASSPELMGKVNEFLKGTNANLEEMKKKLLALKAGLEYAANNPADPLFKGAREEFIKAIDPALKIVNDAITKINDLATNIANFKPEELSKKFDEILGTLGSKLITDIGAKIADNLPDFEDIKDFAKKLGIQPELLENIFTGIIVAETVFSGNLKTFLMGAFSLILANDNLRKEKLRAILGISVPKSSGVVDSKSLAETLRSLNVNQAITNDIINFKIYADAVKATIADRENTLISKMTTQIKTNSDAQINAPLAGNKDIQQEYSRFYEYLKIVNNNLNYYMDLIDTIVKQVRTNSQNEFQLLQKTGPLLQQRAAVEAVITDIRSKLAKYKSYALVVGNVQKRNKLIMDLGVLIPELEKLMGTGISIADLFLSQGGLSAKMKEMSDSLIEDRDRLFAESEKVKKIQKLPVRFKTVPKPSKGTAPEYLGDNQEEAMNPKYFGEYLGDDQNESMNPLYSTAKGIPPSYSTYEDRPKNV